MISALDGLRQLTMTSLILRLFLATILGGLIGLEREKKQRPAGFRTYMLVCLGAALTMILSQYLYFRGETEWKGILNGMDLHFDASRFGAQVINGVGFLGAGTIIVTGKQQVKGLTTAAGLWSSACMGLAIGAGFYECVFIGFVVIVLCFVAFPVIESRLILHSSNMQLYIEFINMSDIVPIIHRIKAMNITIYEMDIDHSDQKDTQRNHAVLSVGLPKKMLHTYALAEVSKIENICSVEEA